MFIPSPSEAKADPAAAGLASVPLGLGVVLALFCNGVAILLAASVAKSLFPKPAGAKPTQPLLGRLWSCWVWELIEVSCVTVLKPFLAASAARTLVPNPAGPSPTLPLLVKVGFGLVWCGIGSFLGASLKRSLSQFAVFEMGHQASKGSPQ